MKLEATDLRRRSDPALLGFETTATLSSHDGRLDQKRARGGLNFAMSMRFDGYNLYAIGSPQTGMLDYVREHLIEFGRERGIPQDCCYLGNPDDPSMPRVCLLPPGTGRRFKADAAHFLKEVREALPAALSSDEFRKRSQQLADRFQTRQSSDVAELQKEAEAMGLTMLPTPNGFAFAPVAEGRVMEHDAFMALPEAERKAINASIQTMTSRLIERLREYPKIQEELVTQQRTLMKDTAAQLVSSLAARLRSHYQTYPAAIQHVVSMQQNLVENVDRILMLSEGQAGRLNVSPVEAGSAADDFYRTWGVNLIVDNGDLAAAPIIHVSNPSLENLIGKIETRFEYGTPVTDFSRIRAGALHRANGGYLIVEVERLLQKPFAWEAIKRCLADREIRIESVSQMMSLAYSVSMDPEPVPLDVKVILLGSRNHYHLLRHYDPEFESLFKIVADFDDEIEWDAEHEVDYVALIAWLIRESSLRHMTAHAVSRLLEHASRLVEDRHRLSARVKDIEDILREADQLAGRDGESLIHARHIDAVMDQRIWRVDRIRELVHENITRGVTVVETRGTRTGQVNGLSVLQIGQLVFGQPSRITATARIGTGDFMDIERESGLAGNIHTKAVMIVSNFIAAHYAREQPMSLHASLVFEQSYGGIEGDSASLAEVCALISAIIDRPIRQDFAITGSMDQHGRAQAIGGVNQKIEGFFDVCRAAGLTGTQGVLIPRSNCDNLMLRDDVVSEVAAGRFHVHALDSVDDALVLLLSPPSGPLASADEIHGAVSSRLRAWHDLRLKAGKLPAGETAPDDGEAAADPELSPERRAPE